MNPTEFNFKLTLFTGKAALDDQTLIVKQGVRPFQTAVPHLKYLYVLEHRNVGFELLLAGVLLAGWLLDGFNLLAAQPVNPNATEEAKCVLETLTQLPNRTENRVISGQHTSHGIKYIQDGYNLYVNELNRQTGKWVGMIGADYGVHSTASEIAAGNQVLIDYWKQGGLITINFHADNPWTGGDSWDLNSVNLVDLITPGTPVNTTWETELDKIAAGLAELQQEGVVVLWRPFHEMTHDNCFWWGREFYQDDAQKFRNIWIHMFNYLSFTKGINNLLWVYAAGDSEPWYAVDLPYPGDSYVDIVGIDFYGDIFVYGENGSAYDRLANKGKPFAVTEIGPGTVWDGSWDNLEVIQGIRERYPAAVWFQHWHSWSEHKAALVDNQHAKELLEDLWVITRDELSRSCISDSIPPLAPTGLQVQAQAIF